MSPPLNEIDDLVKRLEAFHISAKAQKAASSSTPAARVEEPSSSTRTPVYDWRHDGTDASRRVRRGPLAAVKPGERPCWEPPVLEYDHFQAMIEAQQEFVSGEGRKDIAFVTDLMDNLVEVELQQMYRSFVRERLYELGEDMESWRTLLDNIIYDWGEIVIVDLHSILERHGKTNADRYRTMAGVARVMIKQAEGKEGNPLRRFGRLDWALINSKRDAESGNLVEMK